jgi:hypothetical protein
LAVLGVPWKSSKQKCHLGVPWGSQPAARLGVPGQAHIWPDLTAPAGRLALGEAFQAIQVRVLVDKGLSANMSWGIEDWVQKTNVDN